MCNIDKNTVKQNVDLIARNAISCSELAAHYAKTIERTDDNTNAWDHYYEKTALARAAELDDIKSHSIGALHGIPVGVKDIFDSIDFPTCQGSPIHAQRQPAKDCHVIENLKAANALIMGKTVTTEFAFLHPSKTHNPHDSAYSPGGSSSGSAAAVAAGQVPLAIGSQTGGSVIRPASFCGVHGYKPTRGLISRSGVLETSTTLDHVGLFANHLEDMAVLTDTLCGYDPADNASIQHPPPDITGAYHRPVTKPPSIVWVDMPYSDRYSDDASRLFETLISDLGTSIQRIKAPDAFTEYLVAHKTIYDYEIIRALDDQIQNHWDKISKTAQPIFEQAKARTKQQYREALENRQSAIEWFDDFFKQYDAILTPSAISVAPLMGSTGDSICCLIWTLCGLPCINLPILTGENNLPVGVQLVGARCRDSDLFQTAGYIEELMS